MSLKVVILFRSSMNTRKLLPYPPLADFAKLSAVLSSCCLVDASECLLVCEVNVLLTDPPLDDFDRHSLGLSFFEGESECLLVCEENEFLWEENEFLPEPPDLLDSLFGELSGALCLT